MNTLSLPGAPAWFDTILLLSAQATLLAGIVWVILKLLGRWIPPSWRALLWFIVIARVLIPIAPPSAFSLQNIFVKANTASPSPARSPRVEFPDDSRENNLRTTSGMVNSMVFPQSKPLPRKSHRQEISPSKALAIVWASGAILFLTLLAGRSLIIRRRFVRHSFASGSKILETINDCRAQLRLRFPIRIVISDRIAAPALTGLIPARLILPTHFANGHFTPDQIRQILLHEFAHIRQGHLFLHWLTLIARCLQWFNPVIHFAASRLRHECELAADAAVLKNSTPDQRAAYGETILQVLAQSTSPSTVLALGMADQARHLKERLSALSNPNRRSYSVIGILLCAAAAMIGLSGAEQPNADSSAKGTATKVRYLMRIAECPPEMVPQILQSLGAPSTLTNQTRGITNFVLTPEQTKKLASIKEMQGVDFLEAPPEDFPLGPAQIHEIELPDITTNTPSNTQFEPTIQIKTAKREGQSLWLGSDLIITTFLGYSTNSENIEQTNRLPSFRVRSSPATNSVLLGGTLAFYVPRTASFIFGAKKLPVLGDVPLLGRPFRSETPSITNRASLIFLTASNPDGPLPASAKPNLFPTLDAFGVPSGRELLPQPSPFDARPPLSPSQQALFRKLENIRIDRFPIEQPTELTDVLNLLGAEIKKQAPEGRSINFIISTPAESRGSQLSIDVEKFKIKFDPPIRDLTLGQLLDAIVRVAICPEGPPPAMVLQYSVEDYGIVFGATNKLASEPFLSRSFRLDLQALHAASAAKGLDDRSNSLQEIASFLKKAGIQFGPNLIAVGRSVPSGFGRPPEKAIFLNDSTGVLWVRAKADEMQKVEEALRGSNLLKPKEGSVINPNPKSARLTPVEYTQNLIDSGQYEEARSVLQDAVNKGTLNSPDIGRTKSALTKRTMESAASTQPQNPPINPSTKVVPSPEIPPSALARQKLNQKLDSIRIDDFPLSGPVDLIEVAKQLNFETRKLDPERHGINFVLDKAKGRAANMDIDLERFKIKIDPPIRDVTVRQLCDVIARVAAPPPGASGTATLAYSVEDYGVVFSVATRDSETFVSRSFRVNPNNFRSAMDAAYPLKKGEDRLTGARRQLRDFLTAAKVDFFTNNVAVGGSVAIDFGVVPTGQPTKAAFYNDLTGTLFVRAPVSDLDTVEHAIHKLNIAPPQVCISAEIYELPKEEAEQIRKNFTIANALSATNEFLFGAKSGENSTVPTLLATKTIADTLKQPFVATNILSPAAQWILASDVATKLRKHLQSHKDVDGLTMPNVTTLLGREARVSLEETSTIVTGTSTNYFAAMEALGWSVDIIPQSFDGRDLELNSYATRSEFLGYEKEGDLPLPRFRIRQTGSPVKLPPGDSQALLFPVTNTKRVPVLGDIPNLGRLFQTTDDSRYNLILITPTIIDAAGNRVHPKSE